MVNYDPHLTKKKKKKKKMLVLGSVYILILPPRVVFRTNQNSNYEPSKFQFQTPKFQLGFRLIFGLFFTAKLQILENFHWNSDSNSNKERPKFQLEFWFGPSGINPIFIH